MREHVFICLCLAELIFNMSRFFISSVKSWRYLICMGFNFVFLASLFPRTRRGRYENEYSISQNHHRHQMSIVSDATMLGASGTDVELSSTEHYDAGMVDYSTRSSSTHHFSIESSPNNGLRYGPMITTSGSSRRSTRLIPPISGIYNNGSMAMVAADGGSSGLLPLEEVIDEDPYVQNVLQQVRQTSGNNYVCFSMVSIRGLIFWISNCAYYGKN